MTNQQRAYELVQEMTGIPETMMSYWSEYYEVHLSDWQYKVANNDTRLGYWEFVAAELGAIEL